MRVELKTVVIAILALLIAPDAAQARFTVDDYFNINRFSEVALSSDGRNVVFNVHTRINAEQDYWRNGRVPTIAYYQRVDGVSAPVRLDIPEDAHNLEWIAGNDRIGFISKVDGVEQILIHDLRSRTTLVRTHAVDPVQEFRFSTDGRRLAYRTESVPSPRSSVYERLRTAEGSQVMDIDTFSIMDLISPDWASLGSEHANASGQPDIWIEADGETRRLALPGAWSDSHSRFDWSPDGWALSISFIPAEIPNHIGRFARTSVAVYDIAKRELDTIGAATVGENLGQGDSFYGGQWLSATRLVLFRQSSESIIRSSGLYWAVHDVDSRNRGRDSWRQLTGFQPYIDPRRLTVFNGASGGIMMEGVSRGRRTIYELAASAPRNIFDGWLPGGTVSLSAATIDASRIVFAWSAIDRAPELYVRDRNGQVRQLTRLNSAIQAKVDFRYREFIWVSANGVHVSGWLIQPKQPADRPRALVTYVKGGPGGVYQDEFAHYFRGWAYPFEALASDGIAIFIPNYQGASTFHYPRPTDTFAGEPIEDVVSGIRELISQGVADPARLGIAGHSHGATLGPLILGRGDLVFCASAFAEGFGNAVSAYDLASMRRNALHDTFIAPFYANPQEYLRISPVLHLGGADSANLFEGGAQSEAILMLGLAKASRRAGMPTQLVVYPRTNHSITEPRMQREGALRTHAWFRYWLDGVSPPEPLSDEHRSWDAMRANWVQRTPHCAPLQASRDQP